MRILEKVITAVLSTIIFSIGLSLLNETMEYFGVYVIFSGTVFLTGGVLFSLWADHLLRKVSSYTYLLSLFLYGVGGILLNFLFFFIFFQSGFSAETVQMSLLGIIAALIFLHIKLVCRKLSKTAE